MTSAVPETAEDSPPEALAALDDPTEKALYMRSFELELLELFMLGLQAGTARICVGQGWPAAALHPHLNTGLDADPVPLPSARHLEDSVLPPAADVCAAIKEIS